MPRITIAYATLKMPIMLGADDGERIKIEASFNLSDEYIFRVLRSELPEGFEAAFRRVYRQAILESLELALRLERVELIE